MKHRSMLALAMICLALTGCGKGTAETTAPSETTQPIVQTQPPETTPPTTEPTEPSTTEPELILESGVIVTADGDTLESGSVIYEDVSYVKAAEFLNALDGAEFTGNDETGFTLLWQDTEYQFQPGYEGLLRDGATIILASPILTYQSAVWMPVEEMCEMMNISLLPDPDRNSLYCTSIAGDWVWADGVKIPVLMYHGVTDDTWGAAELFVSPSDMEAQIKYLVENGYDTITFEDWDHLEDFDKPVMLTFDDGYLDNYEELFPILRKYNAKATIFVITISVDRDERTMTSAQAKEMTDSGLVSIQSHTITHPHLSESQSLRMEIYSSKIAVARMTGYEPIALCYPYGDSSREVRDMTMEHYKFGLNMTGGLYTTGTDESQITRYYVSRYTTMSEFIVMVKDAGT